MAIIVTDDFTGTTNGATLEGRVAPTGQTWDVETGAYTTQSEKAQGDTQGLVKIDTGLDGNGDGCEVSATVNVTSHSGSTPGVVFGAADVSSRMGVFLDPTNVFLSHAGGTDPQINFSTTINTGQDYDIRIRWVGASITVWLDDVEIITQTMGASDQATYLDGAHTFVGFRGTQVTFDGLSVDNLVTAVSGSLSAALPMPVAALDATTTAAGALATSLPVPTADVAGSVTGTGELAGALPLPTADLAGSVTAAGALAAVLPMSTAAMGGSGGAVPGELAGSLPAPTAVLSGDVVASGALAASLPVPVAALDGSVTTSGELSAFLPLPGASLTSGSSVTGQLAGDLSMPSAALTGKVRPQGPYEAALIRAGAPTRVVTLVADTQGRR